MSISRFAATVIAAAVLTGGAAAAQGEGAAAFEAPSGVYTTDAGHRYITFSYLHQGYSRPVVRWNDWQATLDWNAKDPESSSVSVTIDVASVDSGVEEFDGHLKGGRFFDAENHPKITFESTSLRRTGATTGMMTGDLTIKGVTKPVTLDVQFNKGAYEERASLHKLGFSARASVNRSEFNMGLAVPFVSDQVDIIIETEFVRPEGD